jgi:Tfp pilus assembly protein PilX
MRFEFAQLRHQHCRQRGIALMLVVAVVALASVLGLVMLSTATLSNRASANQGRMFAADYLAQSGVNLAMYYLQYPDRAPSLNASGYWSGTDGDIAISSAVQGTVNVTVARDANDSWTYEVVSTGKSGVQSDTVVSRTTGARIYLRNEYQAKYATATNNDFAAVAGMVFNGDVFCNKTLSFKTSVTLPYGVTGTAHCKAKTTGVGYISTPGDGWDIMTNPLYGSPSSGDLNLYTTYKVRDLTYNCDVIPAATTSLAGTLGVVTKTSSTSNPAGIWYRDGTGSGGTFTLNDNVTINGTLVINGDLTINGAAIVITPNNGYPGLIVTGNLKINQANRSITVNGTTYVGKQLQMAVVTVPGSLANYSKLTINGALLMGTSSLAQTGVGYNIITTVTYDASKAKSADLSSAPQLRYATGVSILRWGLP